MNRLRLPRPRVTHALVRAADFPVTAIIAPAGFGKTVALADYLATERIDHIRYDVRADHHTLFEFVRGFAEALQTRVPSALGSFAGAQERAMAATDAPSDLARWLLEHVSTGMTVVVDDLHNAGADPRSIVFLANVIERSYDRVRWILASRSELELPIASWIAYEKMEVPIDEATLRFTSEEALAAAQDAAIGDDGAEELLRLTDGWPVAFSIALRSSARIDDLEKLADGTREMIYRYLAEQVYHRLPAGERELLLQTCVYTSLDREIFEQRGDDPRVLLDLRRDAGFVYAAADQEYRYHDLFREFLQTELRAKGKEHFHAALRAAAAILETLHRDAQALAAYGQAGELPAVERLLEGSGWEILERGRPDVLESALALLPEEQRHHHAMLLGLEAMLAARHGRFEVAEPWFRLGIERATDIRVQAELTHRYAVELVRNNRMAESIPLLEKYAEERNIDAALRAAILATLATAHVRLENVPAASRYIEQALTVLEQAPSVVLRAKIYQQAAFVMLNAGDFERARSYAVPAVELALANSLYEVAARAYSVLYNISQDVDDDPIASLRYLEQLDECARKGGSTQTQLYALLCIYDIQAQRGEEALLQRLDEQIAALQPALPQTVPQTLLPARALRAAWRGEFEDAHTMLAGTATEQISAERCALRWAEIAVYARAAGAAAAADAAMLECRSVLKTCETSSRRVLRTSLFLAVAELLRGKEVAAVRLVQDVEQALQPSRARLKGFARAVRCAYNCMLDAHAAPAFAASLERLRAENLGGIARLLGALPLSAAQTGGGLNSLTFSERNILRALAGGASSKSIAAQTGRSPQTIDVHIRSICRKLGCRGRIEAIALAANAGWLNAQE